MVVPPSLAGQEARRLGGEINGVQRLGGSLVPYRVKARIILDRLLLGLKYKHLTEVG
ncbi:MAG: hypothetical protein KatS3mg023_0134 [Armatimonadota bacterium]|nr:MAG: hypothetical protein KatS3mg023_0134 [Armatimonadota bacterium]